MKTIPRCLSHYTCKEGHDGLGQVIQFTCHPDDTEEVAEFLRTKVRTVEVPQTRHCSNTEHGFYGRYSRYRIEQHKYAGGGGPGCGGYIEALEISDPPDDRNPFVLHEDRQSGGFVRSRFTEWETKEDLIAAFEKFWGGHEIKPEKYKKQSGFKRLVECGLLPPWFYATGEEHLIGDYAYPRGLQDDPVYRFGKKFIVHDNDGVRSVKTCMGTRFVDHFVERSTGGLISWFYQGG